jgi:hypothetical protein
MKTPLPPRPLPRTGSATVALPVLGRCRAVV